MKHLLRSRRRRNGFTLVEMLVVIGIIGILASIITAGVSAALKFAKRTKANAMAVQIQTAVQAYYTEYGVYPFAGTPASPPSDDYYDGSAAGMAKWQNLIIALCGNVNPLTPGTAATSTVPNTRGISYMAPTRSDLDANAVLKNPFTSATGGAYSPYFFMAVDTGYDGVVGDQNITTPLPDFTGLNYTGGTLSGGTAGGVAVWCSCDQPLGGGPTSKSAFWAHTY